MTIMDWVIIAGMISAAGGFVLGFLIRYIHRFRANSLGISNAGFVGTSAKSLSSIYSQNLRGVLRWVDEFIEGPTNTANTLRITVVWSGRTFQTSYLLAFVCPMFLFFYSTRSQSAAGAVGRDLFDPSAIFGSIFAIAIFIAFLRTTGWKSIFFLVLAFTPAGPVFSGAVNIMLYIFGLLATGNSVFPIVLTLVVILASILVFVFVYSGVSRVFGAGTITLSNALIVLISTAFTGALTLVGAGEYAIGFAFALAFTKVNSGVFAAAMAYVVAVAFAARFFNVFSFLYLDAVIGAFAGVFAVTIAALWGIFNKFNRVGAFWVAVSILYIGAGFVLYFQASNEEFKGSEPELFVVLVLLPLFIAPFVWMSVGLTRYLLRKGLCAANLKLKLLLSFYGLLSSLAVLITFVLIGMVIVELFTAIGYRNVSTEPAAQIVDLLTLGRSEWLTEDQLWARAMVFSILVPTLVHLFIWIDSVVIVLFAPAQNFDTGSKNSIAVGSPQYAVDKILMEKLDAIGNFISRWLITLMIFLGFVCVVIVMIFRTELLIASLFS